ncbi:MAG: hypothetical protein U0271_45025 [Polyangiaceae bacterium]
MTCAVAVLLVACSSEVIQADGGSGGLPSGGAPVLGGAGGGGDHEPPRVTIEAPTPGYQTNEESLLVLGKATDASAIESVMVGDLPVTSDDGFATFSVWIPISLGYNELYVTTRDVLGNEDPHAAFIMVHGLENVQPKFDAVFPGANVAIEGPTIPVRVFASSPVGIAHVYVGGVSGVRVDRPWLVEDVPTNQWVDIAVEDPFGNLTITPYLAETHSLVNPYPYQYFSAIGDGRLVGWDDLRAAIAVLDPNAAAPLTVIADSTLGSGPMLPHTNSDMSVQLLDVTWTDQGIFMGAERNSNHGELVGYRVDPATGDRTLTQSCFLDGPILTIATDGEHFYATTDHLTESHLFRCDPVSGEATFMANLPFRGVTLEFDAVHDRVVAHGWVSGGDFQSLLSAVDRLSGEVTPLITLYSATNFTIVDGEVYVVDYLGLEHLREPGGLELVIPDVFTDGQIAECSAGGPLAFCLSDGFFINRYVLGPSGWVWSRIEPTYGVGSGPMPAESTSIALVDGPLLPFALGGANPTVLTSLDGVRTPTALSAGSELRVLPGGAGVAAEGGVFTRFQASADGVDAISVVPGPDITTLSAFELAPANTLDADPVIVYLTPTELRYRTLGGGDQLLATVANGNGLAVTQDGVVYVGTLFEGVTSLVTVEHGHSPSTISGLPVSLAGMVYDRQKNALVTPAIDIVSLPNLTVEHFDPASVEPLAATVTSLRLGPFAGTYWTVLDGHDWALVDVDHKAVFTVAH